MTLELAKIAAMAMALALDSIFSLGLVQRELVLFSN
jgi:hypothetical protein